MSIPTLIRNFAARATEGTTPDATKVLSRQTGHMRLKPDGKWLPFNATQISRTDRTDFRWEAKVKMAPFVNATVVDALKNKQGMLDVKMFGLIRVVSGRGETIDQGEAQRYLAELAWNPTAMLHNHELTYQELSDKLIRVWYQDPQIYVDLSFDDQGDIVGMRTETRRRDTKTPPEPWIGAMADYKKFDGVRIPSRGSVRWETVDGPFEYWRGEIQEFHLMDS
ncbi:hypothetical protein CA13_46320 [Planctomycetes bacterium CA13]|uniref:Uncharacterized protein n=1 Tax=Novipirellula herctigrandis TaxID=2527986 RepID=A0A5C5Z6Y3_9BACT|nr:hypothetical protein CA13_46320 [Planctomycetes bacterium CA13]